MDQTQSNSPTEPDMIATSTAARSAGLAAAHAGMTPTSNLVSHRNGTESNGSTDTMSSLARVFGGALNAYQQNEANTKKENKLLDMKQQTLDLDKDRFNLEKDKLNHRKNMDLLDHKAQFDQQQQDRTAQSKSDYESSLNELQKTGNNFRVDLSYNNENAMNLAEKAASNNESNTRGENTGVKFVPQTDGGKIMRDASGNQLYTEIIVDGSGKQIDERNGVSSKDIEKMVKSEVVHSGVDKDTVTNIFDKTRHSRSSFAHRAETALATMADPISILGTPIDLGTDLYDSITGNKTAKIRDIGLVSNLFHLDDDDSQMNQARKSLGLGRKNRIRGSTLQDIQSEVIRMQNEGYSQRDIASMIRQKESQKVEAGKPNTEYSTKATGRTIQMTGSAHGGRKGGYTATLQRDIGAENREVKQASQEIDRTGDPFVGKGGKIYYKPKSGGAMKVSNHKKELSKSEIDRLDKVDNRSEIGKLFGSNNKHNKFISSKEEAKKELKINNPEKYKDDPDSLDEDAEDLFNKSVDGANFRDDNIVVIKDKQHKTASVFKVS